MSCSFTPLVLPLPSPKPSAAVNVEVIDLTSPSPPSSTVERSWRLTTRRSFIIKRHYIQQCPTTRMRKESGSTKTQTSLEGRTEETRKGQREGRVCRCIGNQSFCNACSLTYSLACAFDKIVERKSNLLPISALCASAVSNRCRNRARRTQHP